MRPHITSFGFGWVLGFGFGFVSSCSNGWESLSARQQRIFETLAAQRPWKAASLTRESPECSNDARTSHSSTSDEASNRGGESLLQPNASYPVNAEDMQEAPAKPLSSLNGLKTFVLRLILL